jgi:hypothetical protein
MTVQDVHEPKEAAQVMSARLNCKTLKKPRTQPDDIEHAAYRAQAGKYLARGLT